jgi:hypothetical protein
MKVINIMSLVLLLGACSPGFLKLEPTYMPYDKWEIPADLPDQDRIFANYQGVQLNFHSIILDAGSPMLLGVTRYDEDHERDTHVELIKKSYSRVTIENGPAIALPEPSFTYVAKIHETEHIEKGIVEISFVHSDLADAGHVADTIASIAFRGVPDNFIASMQPGIVWIAGKKVTLGENCQWRGPRNVYCAFGEQMNWSIHKDMAAANRAIRLQLNSTKALNPTVLLEDSIEVIFNGKKKHALRRKYEMNDLEHAPMLFRGMVLLANFQTTNMRKFNAFYLADSSDGKAYHWVGSIDQGAVKPGEAPDFLSKVMTFAKPPVSRLFFAKNIDVFEAMNAILVEKKLTGIGLSKTELTPNVFQIEIKMPENKTTCKALLYVNHPSFADGEAMKTYLQQLEKEDNSKAREAMELLKNHGSVLIWTLPENLSEDNLTSLKRILHGAGLKHEAILQADCNGIYSENGKLAEL